MIGILSSLDDVTTENPYTGNTERGNARRRRRRKKEEEEEEEEEGGERGGGEGDYFTCRKRMY